VSGFVDEAQLHVRGGDGGAGAVSFRREAHVPRGGPDGGDGGKGGDVWLEASRAVASLLPVRDQPHRRAGEGRHGAGGRRHGRDGADLVVAVPEGTVVRSVDGELLADLAVAGSRFLAARGGRGGRGNARFLSNRRRAPRFAEQGEEGEERWLRLELKLMADVALVGLPNAGKSTLVARMSAARPKVADYPFTTLEPHLGVVRPGGAEGPEFVVADVPGLVEGASEGRGLGHRFLRHVERARVLAVLVDLGPTAALPPGRQTEVLLDELGRYEPELLRRPRLLVGTKADLLGSEGRVPPWCDLVVSALTGRGVAELAWRLAELVDAARRAAALPASAPVVHRLEPEGADGIAVARAPDGAFVVTGRAALRAVGLSDLTDPEAAGLVRARLRRLGVERRLARAGAREGDEVRIGGLAFTYTADGVADASGVPPS
jgi:GTP-binding protein